MGKAWELVRAGCFEDACAAADEEYAATHSLLPLRNKLCALLSLRRYEDSIALSNRILELDGRQSQTDYLFLGTGLWLSGKHKEATAAWSSGNDTKYADAAGGVEAPLMLLYAAIQLGRNDLQEQALRRLQTLATGTPAKNWPGPLAKFVCDQITEREALTAVSKIELLREKQMCQVMFCIGMIKLRGNDRRGFLEAMRQACSLGGACRSKCEFYLALDAA